MPFSTACPNCDARLQVPDTLAGKRVKCKKCDEAFVARPAAEDEGEAPPPRPAKAKARPADEEPRSRRRDEDDDRPRRRDEDDEPRSRRRDEDDEPRSRRRDDEDDRPRRKGGGKKKGKQKSPLVTVLLIGGAAFVALGIGLPLAIWYAWGREPDLGTTVMDNTRPGGAGKAAGRTSYTATDFQAPDGSFSARLPAAPKQSRQTRQTAVGPVEAEVYAAESADVVVAVTVVPYPNGVELAPGQEGQVLDGAVNGMAAQGRASNPMPVTHQGLPGRDMDVTLPTGQTGKARVIAGKKRLYTIVVGPKQGALDPVQTQAVFDGFQVR